MNNKHCKKNRGGGGVKIIDCIGMSERDAVKFGIWMENWRKLTKLKNLKPATTPF
jgi:hypothetical protein